MLRRSPSRCTTYALGRSGSIVRLSATSKTTDSSYAVRTVPTSVSPAAIVSGSSGEAASTKRTRVSDGVAGRIGTPSSSSRRT